jgi:hypothetical protein
MNKYIDEWINEHKIHLIGKMLLILSPATHNENKSMNYDYFLSSELLGHLYMRTWKWWWNLFLLIGKAVRTKFKCPEMMKFKILEF